VMSYPQRRMIEAITGTYQDPSEALGIQNPIAAFATDVVLDPTNAIPAGALAKLFGKGAKVAGAADEAVSLARRPMLSRTIDNTEDVYSTARLRDPALLNYHEREIAQANTWSENWYKNRQLQLSNIIETNYPNANVQSIVNKLKDLDKKPFYSYLEVPNWQGRPSRNYPTKGISGSNNTVLDMVNEGFGVPQNLQYGGGAINLVKYDTHQAPFLTAVHEGAHGMDMVFGITSKTPITDMVKTSMKQSDASTRFTKDDYDYFSSPEEVYARTQELRATFNLEPKRFLDVDDVKKIQSDLMLFGEEEGANNLALKYIFGKIEPRQLTRWLNVMPALAGAAMIGNQTQKK